jgi:hypothetical protein
VAALTDSGQISFGDIIGNRGASESDVAIKQESEFFAVGSAVGDVDGNGTPNETDDRTALDAAPYSISEFYGANYPVQFYHQFHLEFHFRLHHLPQNLQQRIPILVL